jgi:putative FmdB family regulatory protein
MKFYAHTDGSMNRKDWQLLRDHLSGVAHRAAGYAKDFQAGQLAFAAGLLHDLGKYSLEFQQRLQGEHIRVDHSTAGAQVSRPSLDKFNLLEYKYTYGKPNNPGGVSILPTYEYECPKCGVFEEFQSITAPVLEKCPTCGSKVRRLISRNVSVLYKASGFYTTDYGTNGQKQSNSKTEEKTSAAS